MTLHSARNSRTGNGTSPVEQLIRLLNCWHRKCVRSPRTGSFWPALAEEQDEEAFTALDAGAPHPDACRGLALTHKGILEKN